VGILALYFASRRQSSGASDQERWGLGNVRGALRSIAIMAICAFFVIWAAYRFSHAPINEISPAPDKIAAKVFGSSSSAARGIRFLTAKVQVPAPELLEGLRALRDINGIHPPSYMFGHVKRGGWWYFYPVAIAVKTPLAVLLLAVIGAISLAIGWFRTRADWEATVPIVAFLAPIVVAAPTSLDIGVRHVMPVFAFLAMLAAVGTVRLWNGPASGVQDSATESCSTVAFWGGRFAVAILMAWLTVSSALTHPDYLSSFNELGGSHPENILLISDFDWGQDLTRLSTYLREHQVKHVSIAYDGFYDPKALGFPESEHVDCGVTPSGWVAVEERRARLYSECYPWLSQQKLIATVGKTMRIYNLVDSAGASPASAGAKASN
jgi:hypothetical protein